MIQYDWLKAEQNFFKPLPMLGDVAYQRIHVDTGEASGLSQPVYRHEGSFSDVVSIRIRDSVLTMEGNPSRWGKLDNVFGCTSIDECFAVFNGILCSLGLPPFSKGTRFKLRQLPDNSVCGHIWNGAIIRETHINSNYSVGYNNEKPFIRGVSTLPYRNSLPRLHTNGMACDWLSKLGNANLIYPTVYCKANELLIHTVKKIKSKFGEDSNEFRYVQQLHEFLVLNGVVRFEQKLKSRYLQKHDLFYWGYSEFEILEDLQREFISIVNKLSLTAYDVQTISGALIANGIVDNVKAANTTAYYAYSWMNGERFDVKKSAVQIHRARLRKIGIDIAMEYDASKTPGVVIHNMREISMQETVMPDWYRQRVTPLYAVG
ncbi:phage/plasmid replication domain-containing protein [Escherichia coli]|uniref:phage/plasmid replication domain-containing protein n=1 Tax=Escherichia coli TaxID=562 RepID=UPI000DE0F3A1|nr:phage/plasmid replication protein [Escherichia coli]RBJ23150.1 Replication-associated protein G2P [Escherichia coli]HCP2169415.1 Replication-associated protein G2P [Escherichia coli]